MGKNRAGRKNHNIKWNHDKNRTIKPCYNQKWSIAPTTHIYKSLNSDNRRLQKKSINLKLCASTDSHTTQRNQSMGSKHITCISLYQQMAICPALPGGIWASGPEPSHEQWGHTHLDIFNQQIVVPLLEVQLQNQSNTSSIQATPSCHTNLQTNHCAYSLCKHSAVLCYIFLLTL